MRVVIVARQFGHSWSASAHEAKANGADAAAVDAIKNRANL